MKLKKIAKVFNPFGKAVCPQTAARLLGDKQPYQMFRIIVACVATFMAVNVFAAPYVTNVVAKQRYPWNGLVDISYEVVGDFSTAVSENKVAEIKISAQDESSGQTYIAYSLEGDCGFNAGVHEVVWDLTAQGVTFKSTNTVFRVACEEGYPLYCIIDLSEGSNANAYPVSYLTTLPESGWTDEHKTTKLVMRHIGAGALTKPFYIGVFEVTQTQWELVMGSNPSSHVGGMRPVEQVSYTMIRGTSSGLDWPVSNDVDDGSFLGKLRMRTGLDFDLPTRAQWEYAGRAGETTKYNNGGSSEDDLKQVGRYDGNRDDGKGGWSEHTTVGLYNPSAWGLYDIHGNVKEWVLDSDYSHYRLLLGGAYNDGAGSCAFGANTTGLPANGYVYEGFRLSWTHP